MGLNLTIDHGNTLVKLTLWDEEGALVRHISANVLDDSVVEAFVGEDPIDAIIHCSVSCRDERAVEMLSRYSAFVLDMKPDTPTPLKVDYTSATLGVDRLAAAVGAHSIDKCAGRDILVVDAGTAVTYDVVSAAGHYVGGNIAPGVTMRLKSLNDYTARLPLIHVDEVKDVKLFGDTTESALASGAIRGVIGEIEYYRSRLSADAVTVITGGSASLLNSLTTVIDVHDPHLVGRGLERILSYNLKIKDK